METVVAVEASDGDRAMMIGDEDGTREALLRFGVPNKEGVALIVVVVDDEDG
jgi:hypothetical protein